MVAKNGGRTVAVGRSLRLSLLLSLMRFKPERKKGSCSGGTDDSLVSEEGRYVRSEGEVNAQILFILLLRLNNLKKARLSNLPSWARNSCCWKKSLIICLPSHS